MPSKTFPKEDLIDLVCDDSDTLKVIEDEIIDNSRWSIIHNIVFLDIEKAEYYTTTYSVGATEQQDEGPFEYDDDEIECIEVEPVEVTTIKYKRVKD